MRISTPLAAACALGIGGMALPAAAQVNIEALGLTLTATPAAQSDYLFRGISQTRNRPALQLTLDLEHSSGFYIGAFASNVAFLGTDARQEIDALAGYRFELATVKFDIGGIYYTYPGYQAQPGPATRRSRDNSSSATGKSRSRRRAPSGR